MFHRSALFLTWFCLALATACGESENASSPGSDAATTGDGVTTSDTSVATKDAGPVKGPDASSDAGSSDAGKDGVAIDDALEAALSENVVDHVDAAADAGLDASADAIEAATCGEAELLAGLPAHVLAAAPGTACVPPNTPLDVENCPALRAFVTACASGMCGGQTGCTITLAWHDVKVDGTTLTVLLDLSSPVSLSYAEDVGCSGSTSTCVLQASMKDVAFTLELGTSVDAGKTQLVVTNAQVQPTDLMSAGCGLVSDLLNSVSTFLASELAGIASNSVGALRNAVESQQCE